MKADSEDVRQELDQMKQRISALERAFDSILTKDDEKAVREAQKDLKLSRTVSLTQIKKKNA